MGSWANSLHVRHSDPAAVAAAVRSILVADKSAPERPVGAKGQTAPLVVYEDAWDDDGADSDDEGDDGGTAEEGPSDRRVLVCRPVNGWVGILDSEGIMDDLGERLSARLKSETLMVYVNDSDSWGYELRRDGRSIDRYDSCGDPEGLEDAEAMSPELQAAIERNDEAEIERLIENEVFLKNSPKGPIVFHDGRMAPPPEMSILQTRMREGRASIGDRLRYAWLWLKFQVRRLVGWLFPSTLNFGYDVPQSKPMGKETIAEHARKIREFFPEAAGALESLLPQSRFPAEDLLREFLTIVGLPSLYAYLSYEYREDFGDDELQQAGIVPVERLP